MNDVILDLDTALAPVRFERDSNVANKISGRPDGVEVWVSDYAVVAYCPAISNERGTSDEFKDACQDWLEELVRKVEGEKKGLLDAYLVIGLPESPSEEIFESMRRISGSSDFSRKHFVWPTSVASPDSEVTRAMKLTIAAIPSAPTEDLDFEAIEDEGQLFSEAAQQVIESNAKDIRSLASQFISEVENDG